MLQFCAKANKKTRNYVHFCRFSVPTEVNQRIMPASEFETSMPTIRCKLDVTIIKLTNGILPLSLLK